MFIFYITPAINSYKKFTSHDSPRARGFFTLENGSPLKGESPMNKTQSHRRIGRHFRSGWSL